MSTDNKPKSAREIVDENFKGLKDFISNEDILEWHKVLIENCMKEYASQPKEPVKLPSDEEILIHAREVVRRPVERMGFFGGAQWMRDQIQSLPTDESERQKEVELRGDEKGMIWFQFVHTEKASDFFDWLYENFEIKYKQ